MEQYKTQEKDLENFLNKTRLKIDLNNVENILEVASCDGYHACEFAQLFPNSKIYTFEASPDNQIDAENYIKNKGIKNVILTKSAVSEVDGFIDFYPIDKRYCPGSTGSSSCFKINPEYRVKEPVYQLDAIKVLSIRLDTFLKNNNIKKVDLFWLDCQGSELSVLKSLSNYLFDIKAIFGKVEFKPQYLGQPLAQDVNKFLNDNGFEFIEYKSPNSEWFSEAIYLNKRFYL